MINKEDVFSIAYVTRTHGIHGELELQITDDVFDYGNSEYLVFEIEGILVPFFWEEYRFKSNDSAIFKFTGIDSDVQGHRYIGTKIYYPLSALPKEEECQINLLKSFIGYKVFSPDGELLGTVTDVDESSANTLFTIRQTNEREILIPFHEDLLLQYSITERTLSLKVPQGLVELNN